MRPGHKAKHHPGFCQQPCNAHVRRCPSGGSREARVLHAFVADALGDQKGEFQSLAGIEPRVAVRQIPFGQRSFAHSLSAADALGHILAGQFEMHAAGVAPFGVVNREGSVQFIEDPPPAEILRPAIRESLRIINAFELTRSRGGRYAWMVPGALL